MALTDLASGRVVRDSLPDEPNLPDSAIVAAQSEPEELEPPRPAIWKVLLRGTLGIALIAFLLWRSDLRSIGQALAGARLAPILFGTLLMFGLIVVSVFRWRVFLQRLRIHLPVSTTMRLYFVGAFFNAFLPTGVGGDAYKAIRLRSASTPLSTSFASVLLDRIVGIEALAAMGLGAVLVNKPGGSLQVTAIAVALGVLGAGILLLVVGDAILGRGRSRWFGLRPALRRTLTPVVDASRDGRTIGLGILGGFGAQVLSFGAHVSIASALRLDVPPAALLIGLLVATVAATAPLTINGVGVREAVWVWILGTYGINNSEALAFALLALAINLAVSAVGGLVYAVAGGEVKRRE